VLKLRNILDVPWYYSKEQRKEGRKEMETLLKELKILEYTSQKLSD
jgi:hypothetical protein